MSHIGGGYSNITVVQRVTPALRVAPAQAGVAVTRKCDINSCADMNARVFFLSIST
jgi:hypothetical protein